MLLSRKGIEENKGREFAFSYAGATAKVKLRLLPRIKQLELQDRHMTEKTVRGMPYKEVDDAAYEKDRLDYCIVDWSGIETEDESGAVQGLSCTRENKLWLVDNFPPFDFFVRTNLALMGSGSVAMVEQEEKNLPSSPGGTG